jgi:hypothetical protein
LETGYSVDKIEEFLNKFQQYGKVIISQSTTEIMLVNWFKHNFKNGKRAIAQVNKELKDVKDKELLKIVYDYCLNRQCPVKEIFNGVDIPGVKIEEKVKEEKIVEAVPEIKEEADAEAQEEEIAEGTIVGFWNFAEECAAETQSGGAG